MLSYMVPVCHMACYMYARCWFVELQERAGTEASKLRMLAQHVVRITQRTQEARWGLCVCGGVAAHVHVHVHVNICVPTAMQEPKDSGVEEYSGTWTGLGSDGRSGNESNDSG